MRCRPADAFIKESETKTNAGAAGGACKGSGEGLKPAGDSAEVYQPRASEPLRRAARLPLRHGAAFTTALCLLFYTAFTFYSFSSFLPFDGLLCVQAVGKFSVMMRSSSTGNSPHRYQQADVHPHPSQREFTLSRPRPPPPRHKSPPESLSRFQNLCRFWTLTGTSAGSAAGSCSTGELAALL